MGTGLVWRQQEDQTLTSECVPRDTQKASGKSLGLAQKSPHVLRNLPFSHLIVALRFGLHAILSSAQLCYPK